jgi:hypothetical protein
MQEGDLLNKLERVERIIRVYDKKANELLEEVAIDVPLDKLKLIVAPKDGDDELYLPYVLEELKLKSLNELIGNLLKLEFGKNYYVLEADGIYNW